MIDVGVDTLHADGAAVSALGPAGALELLHAHGDAPLRPDAEPRGQLDAWRPRADAVAARVPVWLESASEIEARHPELSAAGVL
ncbi:MAG: hypothetical protein ACJ79L_12960, partial [Anaeromyxobacteraceae bacterium]